VRWRMWAPMWALVALDWVYSTAVDLAWGTVRLASRLFLCRAGTRHRIKMHSCGLCVQCGKRVTRG
jgi:hypothetical protein